MQIRILFIGAGALALALSTPVAADCGCTGMSVTFAGPQDICSNNWFPIGADAGPDNGFPECTARQDVGPGTACQGFAYIYICPTGVNSEVALEQKTGFKVEADYAGGSDGAQCTAGQILQLSITSNMGADIPDINPTTLDGDQDFGTYLTTIDNDEDNAFPAAGSRANGRYTYGGDNYQSDSGQVIIGQTDGGVQWWDNTDQAKDGHDENASWEYRFLSFVRGSGGENPDCSCAFDIDVIWLDDSPAVTNFVRSASGSVNCNHWD
ncbi:hypothetical protein GCM10011316_24470 [Roseibium aquae]|uniref:Uncharacterized protein n=1 Tax=Roseibium aquae TaxID=1323746 RepID=A0A916TKB7_9HYPH|nr:hypothetical protein [Roseibium aquae]GGB51548.1 hypothetical protein GCM10011316_24470 [Roseibium aquae]